MMSCQEEKDLPENWKRATTQNLVDKDDKGRCFRYHEAPKIVRLSLRMIQRKGMIFGKGTSRPCSRHRAGAREKRNSSVSKRHFETGHLHDKKRVCNPVPAMFGEMDTRH